MTNYFQNPSGLWSPKDVKELHVNDDVDSANAAHHHTIGDGIFQVPSGADYKKFKEETLARLLVQEDINSDLDVRLVALEYGTVPWTDVTFANGWTHFDAGRKAQVCKVGPWVQFRGIIKSGVIGSGVKAFSVPMSCAPINRTYADHHWPVVTNPYVFGVVQAKASDGSFEVVSGSNTWLDISNIHYLTI